MLTKQTQAVLKHASLSAIWSTFMIYIFYFGRWKLTVVPSISPRFWMLITKHVKPFPSKWQELVKMEMFYSCIQKVVQFIWLWKIPSQCRHIYFLSLILFNCMQYLETILLLRVAHINLKFSTLLRFEHKKFKKPNNLKSHVEFRAHICLKTQPSYTCICHWKDMSNPKFPAL